jgi:hypothetical protein
MKQCKLVIVLVILVAFSLSGCMVLNRVIYGPMPQFPQPYQSHIQFKAVGEKTLEYEILGEGYGESTGYAFLGGLFILQPDAMKAYEQAVKTQGGDILLEARTQLVTKGVPFIYTEATLKVWGLVAKVKKKLD